MENQKELPDLSLFNELQVLILAIDENFNIIFWNSHLEEVTGISARERVGFNLLELYPRLYKNAFKSRIENVLNGGPPSTLSYLIHGHFIEIVTPDQNLQKQSTIVKYHSATEEIMAFSTITIFDMSEVYNQRVLVNTIKEEAINQLEKSNDLLKNFAGTIAHDISTPLLNIKSLSELILEIATKTEGFSQEGIEIINMIEGSVSRLSDLTHDLLNYSRAKNINVPEQPVDLNILIKEILLDLEVFIDENNGEIKLEDELPEILGWNFLLRQLFQNLIVNAIKYKRDGVDPLIKLSASSDDSHEVVTIEDNGMGFSEEDAKKIFQPFRRLDDKHSVAGSGIGLATCQRIIEQHKGEIEAIGIEGKGSKFLVKLPKKQ